MSDNDREAKTELDPTEFYAAVSALSCIHDLFSAIVEEDRVAWSSETEQAAVSVALQQSKSVLERDIGA